MVEIAQQPESGTPPSVQPPRLWDFKVLRLPILELVVLALLVIAAFLDVNYMTGGNGLITFFIILPLLAVILVVYAVTFPLQRKPVTEFEWDIGLLIIGALGILGWTEGIGVLALFVGILPGAVSLLVRRKIACIRWKKGFDPRTQ